MCNKWALTMRSADLLEKIMDKEKWTAYRLAQELDVKPSSIYRLLNRNSVMSDYIACQVAVLLDIPEMEVISLCNYERSLKESERNYWKKKLQVLVKAATLGLMIYLCNIGSNSADLDARKNTKNLISGISTAFFIIILLRITYIMLN